MEPTNVFEALTAVIGGTAAVVLVIAGIFLTILYILMPAFIYMTWKEAKRMRKLAERNHWQIEQIRFDVDRVKQKWGA